MPPQYQLSVIIPTWGGDFHDAVQLLSDLPETPKAQWIIASYNPPSDWQELIADSLHSPIVINCEHAGRGLQLNEGAKVAQGKLLVFNHADTLLRPDHLQALLKVDTTQHTAGAFHRILAEEHHWIQFLDPAIRWYNQHLGILFGDQTVFITKQEFDRLGGFQPLLLVLFRCGVCTDHLYQLYYWYRRNNQEQNVSH